MPTALQPSRERSKDRDPNTADTTLKSHLSKHAKLALGLLAATLGLVSCRSQPQESGTQLAALDRAAWLGSAEGWGLLGLPLEGGPLSYRNAQSLESPTWAPPELGVVVRAWPGEGAIWVQLEDSGVGRYDYATGHLLSFEGFATAERAVALEDGSGLVIAPEGKSLERVAESEPWRVPLPGRLVRLAAAGGGRVVAVVDSAAQTQLLVLEPPEEHALGRRSVRGIRDLVVPAWGDVLYYLSTDAEDTAVHGVTLPALEEAEGFVLPAPGQALAITPSGHRLYVAAGRDLYVFDRLKARLLREVALPGVAAALRFSFNGSNLLAQLGESLGIAVLQVGSDSLLGVVSGDWGDDLPQGLPGGRLIVRSQGAIVLYDLTRLVEIARDEPEEPHLWLAVKWQPPRPRIELARRTAVPVAEGAGRGEAAPADTFGDVGSPGEETGAPPGHYAVVSAARQPAGVRNLVSWLRSVGYPGRVDQHEDVMGVLWFRAMVGPYRSRDEAESAARLLGARYGYKPWILSIEESDEAPASPVDSAPGGPQVPAGPAAEVGRSPS